MGDEYVDWAQRLDQTAAGWANGVIGSLPQPLLALVAAAAIFGMYLFGRMVVQGLTTAPPTFEGIPLIGGILKFAKVRM